VEKRTLMAKSIAEQYLEKLSQTEHRVRIFYGAGGDQRSIPSLLRSFRDGRIRMSGVSPTSHIGLSEEMDGLVVWSSDEEFIRTFCAWCDARGIEHTGVV
jgi:hypothetical protein